MGSHLLEPRECPWGVTWVFLPRRRFSEQAYAPKREKKAKSCILREGAGGREVFCHAELSKEALLLFPISQSPCNPKPIAERVFS